MNKVVAIGLSAAAILLMSGCGGKDIKIGGGNTAERSVSALQMYGMTKSSIINNTNTKLLQASADEAINAGYPFFAFNSPGAVLDANITTAEEFLAKCADKNVGVGFIPGAALFIHDDCDMFMGATGMGYGGSVAGFTLHKEKPLTASLNASDVIATMKTKGLYKEGYSIERTGSK
jgi:hypothetical protein